MAVMITFRRSGAGVVPNGGDYLKGHGGVLEWAKSPTEVT